MLRVNGFYGHVRRNDLRSVATFAGFLIALQVGAAAVLALPLLFLDFRHSLLFPSDYAARYAPLVLVFGIALFALRFVRHVASMQARLRFTSVDRRCEPRLVNLVETMAITAGLPLPEVGVIESPARNAFACGLSPASAVVVVTRGLLDALDERELRAVIAHEIAHIRNGDIRMMAAANVLLDTLLQIQRGNVLKISNWRRAVVALVFTPYLIAAVVCGLLSNGAVVLARVSRLLIGSSREFVADAQAVQLTQDPEALISALRRIAGYSAIPDLDPCADAMMIDGAASGPFANHPPIAERIAVLARLSIASTERLHFGLRTSPPRGTSLIGADPLAPARALVARVNEGATENLFGVSPGAARVLLTGFILCIVLQFWSMGYARQQFTEIGYLNPSFYPEDSRVREVTDRLETQPPVQARCFATDRYTVEERDRDSSKPVDANLVEAYRSGRRTDDRNVLERYLAVRQTSIRATEGYRPPAERDRALVGYVRTRKRLLQVAHRFFGKSGLTVMNRAYDSPEDRAVLAALRRSFTAGTLPFGSDEARLRDDIPLLLARPVDFIPCRARAPAVAGASG